MTLDTPLTLAALVVVAAEWLALGWFSAVGWPGGAMPLTRWAVRLLVGAWLVGLAQLLLALLGPGFGSVPLVVAVAALLAATCRGLASAVGVGSVPQRSRIVFEGRDRLGWLLLGVVLCAATARAIVVPEAGWDAYSHWGLKAHAFASHSTIVNAGTTHEYYPPLAPLLEAWLLQHHALATTLWPLTGVPSIDVAKAVWPLIGAALAICIAEHLRRTLRHAWLAPYAATAILLATTQLLEGFWTGQADLALATYLTLATLAAFQWLRSADRLWLVQIAIFGAAAALTKHEGLPRLGVLAAALVLEAIVTRQRTVLIPVAVVAASATVGYAPWLVFRTLNGMHVTSEHLSQFQPQAIGNVILATAASVAGVRTGGGILAAGLAWLAAGRLLFDPPLRVLTLTVAAQLAATLLAFLISETTPEVQARTSATRLIQQFLPVALFVSAVALERILLGRTPAQAANGVVKPQAVATDARPIIAPWR